LGVDEPLVPRSLRAIPLPESEGQRTVISSSKLCHPDSAQTAALAMASLRKNARKFQLPGVSLSVIGLWNRVYSSW
jgi:hypothetical protein